MFEIRVDQLGLGYPNREGLKMIKTDLFSVFC